MRRNSISFMKSTKLKLAIIFCLMAVSSLTSAAQNFDSLEIGSGIYLTESDFLKNKISLYARDDAFNYLERSLDDVILMRGGKKFKLSKGSFFGYSKQGARYRFYQDDAKFLPTYGYYKIEEDSGIVIYSKEVTALKTGTHTWYYYSETLDSPVKKLSSKSLKHVSGETYAMMAKYALMRSGKNLVSLNK